MTLNQLKKKILQASLDLGVARIYVAPNTHWKKVILPKGIMQRYGVILGLSYKFKGGLEILDHGVKTVLFFDNELCEAEVPWEAIVKITNSKDEDHSFMDIYTLPGDTEMEGTEVEVTDEEDPKPKPVRHLKVVH